MQYLNANHGLYVEGNDWVADHRNTDLLAYFNIAYDGVSGNGAISSLTSEDECRFGRNQFSYSRSGYAINRPDYIDVLEGAEPILESNGGQLRSAFFDGHDAYRTYSFSASTVAVGNQGDFRRAEYLREVIEALAGYRGTVTGTVTSNLLGTPIENAIVSLPGGYLYDVTDENGQFTIDRIATEQFTLNVQCEGYTTLEEAQFNFNGNREIDVELAMRHPIMEIAPASVEVENPQDNEDRHDVQISNVGDGPLSFTSRLRAEQVECDLWDIVGGYDAGAAVEDSRLQAAVFLHDHYWIAGGNSSADEPNLLYKVNLDGDLVESYPQETQSNYGYRDMTTDGEFLYGVESNYIVQISPESGLPTGLTIEGQQMPDVIHCITYDPDNEWFWVAGPTTNILAFDIQGSWERLISNRNRFRMSGLFFYPDDPDGYQLYVSSTNDLLKPVMIKVDWNTQEEMEVCMMERFDGESPGGGEMSSEIVPYTTVLVCQMQGREDWVRLFEAGTDFDWVSLFPTEGELQPDDELAVSFKFNANGLTVGETYEAYVQIDHNTPEEEVFWIDFSMTVTEPDAVDEDVITPYEFGINSVYPNPFNPTTSIEFSLDRVSNVSIDVFDLSGRLIDNIMSGALNAGNHTVTLSGHDMTSGVYIVQMRDDNRVSQRKVTLVK